MAAVGVVALFLFAIVVLLALGFVILSLPDIGRYRRLRKM